MLYRDIIAVESEWILIKYFRYFPMPEYIYISSHKIVVKNHHQPNALFSFHICEKQTNSNIFIEQFVYV